MFSYFAYGLGIESDIEIPEFVSAKLSCDVKIRLDRDTSVPVESFPNCAAAINLTEDQAVIFNKDIGIFTIRGGSEIIVTPFENVDLSLIRLFLMGGSVIGILLYQRGLFILHGSAVEVDGGAVAFIGKSGWGKSSITAALHTMGHRMITDDVLAVSLSPDGFKVFPGYPQLKVFPEVAECLGRDKSSLNILYPEFAKSGFQATHNFSQASLPLKQIYVLAKDNSIAIEPISPQQAVMEILRHSIPTRWFQPKSTTHFLQCTSLVKNTPIYRLQRSNELRSLPSFAQMVKEHFTSNHQTSNT